ncbi:MAG: LysM peptidoglycan-binding domain-containing protein [Anaerolineae bacterium]
MRKNLKLLLVLVAIAAPALAGCARARPEAPDDQPGAASGGTAAQTTPLSPLTPTTAPPTPAGQPTTLAIHTPTPETTGAEAAAATPEAGATATPLPPVVKPTSITSPQQGRVHIVQAGQNLFRIALQYGYDVDTLARYNNIANPNLIYVGQSIKIPGGGAPVDGGGGTYVVQPGDTLLTIAVRFNTTIQALLSANNLANPDLIYVGQELRVP